MRAAWNYNFYSLAFLFNTVTQTVFVLHSTRERTTTHLVDKRILLSFLGYFVVGMKFFHKEERILKGNILSLKIMNSWLNVLQFIVIKKQLSKSLPNPITHLIANITTLLWLCRPLLVQRMSGNCVFPELHNGGNTCRPSFYCKFTFLQIHNYKALLHTNGHSNSSSCGGSGGSRVDVCKTAEIVKLGAAGCAYGNIFAI